MAKRPQPRTESDSKTAKSAATGTATDPYQLRFNEFAYSIDGDLTVTVTNNTDTDCTARLRRAPHNGGPGFPGEPAAPTVPSNGSVTIEAPGDVPGYGSFYQVIAEFRTSLSTDGTVDVTYEQVGGGNAGPRFDF